MCLLIQGITINFFTIYIIIGLTLFMFLFFVWYLGKCRKYDEEKKLLKKKTQAIITEINYKRNQNYQFITYTYTVDGVEYNGCGSISSFNASTKSIGSKVTIYYDPHEPSRNNTAYWKTHHGTNSILPTLIIIIIVVALTYFLHSNSVL